MTTRQVKAVAEAISNASIHSFANDGEHLAKAAIAASDARFVPMLVEALQNINLATQHDKGNYALYVISQEALSQLPEEMRG